MFTEKILINRFSAQKWRRNVNSVFGNMTAKIPKRTGSFESYLVVYNKICKSHKKKKKTITFVKE